MSINCRFTQPECRIVAYGNRYRGDDGAGPYVAHKLQKRIGHLPSVKILIYQQLDPVLLEEIRDVHCLVFVDACVEKLQNGVRWSEVQPVVDNRLLSFHHLDPHTFMGLFALHYRCRPAAWIVSVQGCKFDFCETLEPVTRYYAERAAKQISGWLYRQCIYLPNETIDERG